MKNFAVGTISVLCISLGAFAQGTISFKNINTSPPINAPINLDDGTTKASGSGFLAGLMAGTQANNLAILGVAVPLGSGNGAGYFAGGVVSLPGIPGGSTAFVQVIFWSTAAGATFPAAQASNLQNSWGQSPIFSVTTGDPSASPPTTPAFLVGLGTTPLQFSPLIPEPSPWAILSFGIAAILLGRRRTR